ncbi:MAG: cadherin-like domain-containing protein [Pseudomonadota bacterium]
MTISSRDYAIFSKFVYHNSTVFLPSGWEIYRTSDSENTNVDGYSGQAYINRSTGEIVIAHRGTEGFLSTDLFVADLQLALDQIPTQYTNDLTQFVSQVKAQMTLEGLNLNNISYTGHSLGGVLAQLSAIEDFKNGSTGAKAVVFDSPGVTLGMANEILNYSLNPNLASRINISNYMTSPNLVNTTNPHDFGINYRIYPDFDPGTTGAATSPASYLINYTLKQHDMLGILSQFNPTTGEPKIYSTASSWPSSGYDYFKSYDQNPHYWDLYFIKENFTDAQKINYINQNLGGSHDLNQTGATINGDNTSNYIWGATNAQDTIHGNGNNDVIFGEGGNDKLYGDDGNDTLDGGTGADTYIFSGNFGRDVINDDGLGNKQGQNDVIRINGKVISGLAQLIIDHTNSGNPNGDKIYQMMIEGSQYQLHLTGNRLTIVSGKAGDSSSDLVVINDFNNGDYGIGLLTSLPARNQVNTYNQGYQYNESITHLSNGGFVINWISEGNASGSYLQRFDANGNKLGSEIFVSNNSSNDYLPITDLPNGGFVMSWTGDYNQRTAIFMQRFDVNGNKLGAETLVNTNITNFHYHPSITTLSSGNFVISWDNNSGVFMQRFDASGNKLGSETQISSGLIKPAITALNNGGFVVAWQNYQNSAHNNTIFMQRFDANGNKIGTEIAFNNNDSDSKTNPALAPLNNGGFVLLWNDGGNLGDPNHVGIMMQRFDPNGNRVGSEVVVGRFLENSIPSTVTSLKNGNFVVSWNDSSYNVYTQRFDINGNKLGVVNVIDSNSQFAAVEALNDGGFVVSWTNSGKDGDGYGVFMQKFDAQGEKVVDFAQNIKGNSVATLLPNLSSQLTTQINQTTYNKTEGSNFSEIITPQNTGNNFIDAQGGDDKITTLGGNDVISAGAGNDIIKSGGGNDIIIGGAGADQFIITAANNSRTTITDFEFSNPNEKIDLSALTNIRNFSSLNITNAAGHSVINLANGQIIDIINPNQTQLSASNFTFAPSINHNPTANLVVSATNEDTAKIIDVLAAAADIDVGDVLSIGSITSPAHGTARIITNPQTNRQTISYTPGANYNGSDSFNYTIIDGNGGSITKTININVVPINDAPIVAIQLDNQTAQAGNNFNFKLPNNIFSDVDSTLRYSAKLANGAALPAWLSFNASNQTFTGTPPAATSSHLDITIIASDGSLSAAQNFSLNIVSNVINGTAGNDNIFGTLGSDIINGNAGNDTIIGGIGADKIDGGAGIDTASYVDSLRAININLATNINKGGAAAGDVLLNIENITGSNFDDTLVGDNKNNVLSGGKGNDTIIGGIGADKIDGGAGIDAASYTDSTSAVVVNLKTNLNIGGAAAGDILLNIENIIGSNFNDNLAGDANNNMINGGLGADQITGNQGQDFLIGGAGADIFNFNSFSDSTINARDLIADFQRGQDKINLHNLNLAHHHISFDANPNDNVIEQGLSYHFDQNQNTVIEYHDGNDSHNLVINLIGKINFSDGDFGF